MGMAVGEPRRLALDGSDLRRRGGGLGHAAFAAVGADIVMAAAGEGGDSGEEQKGAKLGHWGLLWALISGLGRVHEGGLKRG